MIETERNSRQTEKQRNTGTCGGKRIETERNSRQTEKQRNTGTCGGKRIETERNSRQTEKQRNTGTCGGQRRQRRNQVLWKRKEETKRETLAEEETETETETYREVKSEAQSPHPATNEIVARKSITSQGKSHPVRWCRTFCGQYIQSPEFSDGPGSPRGFWLAGPRSDSNSHLIVARISA